MRDNWIDEHAGEELVPRAGFRAELRASLASELHASTPGRPMPWRATGWAAAAAVLVVAVVVATRDDTRRSITPATSTATTAVTTPATTATTPTTTSDAPLDPGPLSPRFGSASTAVDGKLVVFGGTDRAGTLLDDGAAYDPATATWTMLPSSGGLAAGASTAMTDGRRAIFVATQQVAAFDFATGRWTTMESVPDQTYGVVVRDNALFALGETTVARLDPTFGTWTTMPPIPQPNTVVDVVDTGDVLVVITDPRVATDPPLDARRSALRLDGDTWTDLAMPARDWLYGIVAVGVGHQLIVWAERSTNDRGLAYSFVTGTWRDIARAPQDWWECYSSTLVVPNDDAGAIVLDMCGTVASYDVTSDTMTPMAPADPPSPGALVLIDGAIYRWGAENCYVCEQPPVTVFQRLR